MVKAMVQKRPLLNVKRPERAELIPVLRHDVGNLSREAFKERFTAWAATSAPPRTIQIRTWTNENCEHNEGWRRIATLTDGKMEIRAVPTSAHGNYQHRYGNRQGLMSTQDCWLLCTAAPK